MKTPKPSISICIPHWQVQRLISICLRSIRKHSSNYDIEILVVDNGSKDDSLYYLRSLEWVRLIERPDETSDNWPRNVFTAWDEGIRKATGDYFITMHSDVFAKSNDWLEPYVEEMAAGEKVGGAGAWKLNLEHPVYLLQKRVFGVAIALVKRVFGKKKRIVLNEGQYPRDYCAMYRRDVILNHDLTFCPVREYGGGYSIAKQIWEVGYETRMIPVRTMVTKIEHIAHGTAATKSGKRLKRARSQRQFEQKAADILSQPWIKELESDDSLDR